MLRTVVSTNKLRYYLIFDRNYVINKIKKLAELRLLKKLNVNLFSDIFIKVWKSYFPRFVF